MRLEIINHPINHININISEEVNVKARENFLVDRQFVCNDILNQMFRKHTTRFVVRSSPDISSWILLFLTFLLIQS